MRTEITVPLKLDRVDRQILSILQQNARTPLTTLSQTVQRPKPTVFYHLNMLEKEKVIRNYQTHLALFKPYLHYAIIFAHINHSNLESTRAALARDPHCVTLFSMSGAHNILFGIAYPATVSEEKIINEMNTKYHLTRSQWSYVEDFSFFIGNYSREKPEIKMMRGPVGTTFQSSFDLPGKKVELNREDIPLFRALTRNARASLVELTEKTGMSKETVKRRISELIRGGIIKKFSATINPHAFEGVIPALLIARMSDSDVKILRKYVAANQMGNGLATMSNSPWNIVLFLHFYSKHEMQSFERQLPVLCPTLQDYQLELLHEQYTLNWLPPIVEETLTRVLSKKKEKEL